MSKNNLNREFSIENLQGSELNAFTENFNINNLY